MRNKTNLVVVVCVMTMANIASADTFGTEGNQFTIDFVSISGDASSANGMNISQYSPGDSKYRTFTDPGSDYRMGTYEITNDQWSKFSDSYGTVTGSPSNAYQQSATFTGTNVSTNEVSWYETAQFVNYLNTSKGYSPAYKFTGTLGTNDYTYAFWDIADVGYDSDNPFRNSNAFYFLPTEDEWVKAAYWNGTNLQTYATTDDFVPVAGVDTNYDQDYPQSDGPWDVGSGSEELNGTFDMMGNVSEWMESPLYSGDSLSGSSRGLRGDSYRTSYSNELSSSNRYASNPINEEYFVGFRVASVPEPATLFLLGLGTLMLRKKQ